MPRTGTASHDGITDSESAVGFRPRGTIVTTILRTIPAQRMLRPIVMTASLVLVPSGAHGPADLPITVDRAPAHSRDTIALWSAKPAGVDEAA